MDPVQGADGKRPLSSMTPTIILKDEQLKAVVGARSHDHSCNIRGDLKSFCKGNGSTLFCPGSTVLSSGDAAYFPPQLTRYISVLHLYPNVVHYENWTTVTGVHFELPAQIRKSLQKKGHVLEPLAGGAICQFIVIQALKKNGGGQELVAVSDPRKGGIPAGF